MINASDVQKQEIPTLLVFLSRHRMIESSPQRQRHVQIRHAGAACTLEQRSKDFQSAGNRILSEKG